MRRYNATETQLIVGLADQILAKWQHQVGDFVATGESLIQAHATLINLHGAWSHMVRTYLPFSHGTAKKLMAIARHPILSNSSNWNRLPANWTTLYALYLVNPAVLLRLMERGVVNVRTRGEEAAQMEELTLEEAETWEPTEQADRTDDIVELVREHHRVLTRLLNELGHRHQHGEPLTPREMERVLTAADEMTGAVNLIDSMVRPAPSVKRIGG
jgi:hypothetical protein